MKNFLTEGSCVFLWKFDCVCLWFILRNPRNKGRNLWHGVLMMSVAGLFHWILIFTVNHSVRMPLMEWSCPIWPVKCWHQTLVLVSGVIHLTYYFLKFFELLIRGPVGMICRITFLFQTFHSQGFIMEVLVVLSTVTFWSYIDQQKCWTVATVLLLMWILVDLRDILKLFSLILAWWR